MGFDLDAVRAAAQSGFALEGKVLPAWIDYNGHMNVAYYLVAFDTGLDAFVDALEQGGFKDFQLLDYRQHSIGGGSKTKAAAYIQMKNCDGSVSYGCGINANIELAGLRALVSAFNRAHPIV